MENPFSGRIHGERGGSAEDKDPWTGCLDAVACYYSRESYSVDLLRSGLAGHARGCGYCGRGGTEKGGGSFGPVFDGEDPG